MLYWGYWIGPFIAVVLALRLRPTYLVLLALATMTALIVSFGISQGLYPDCGSECPRTEHVLVWVNGILATITPALLLLALLKHVLRSGSGFSAKPS